jgi:DNA-binding MarR family transcriptional regulator
VARKNQTAAGTPSTEEVAALLLRWMSASMRTVQRGGVSESLRIVAEHGVTMPMTVALHVLAFTGAQTMTQLSAHLGLSPSATSHLLQRLVELDFAQRADDPGDRRRRLLMVTEHGRRIVEDLMAARLAELRASLEPLSAPTLSRMRAALVAVLDELAAADSPVCPAPGMKGAPLRVRPRAVDRAGGRKKSSPTNTKKALRRASRETA